MAEEAEVPRHKEQLLGLAREYDKLAERAQRRSEPDPR
jgi:hypothetical protein